MLQLDVSLELPNTEEFDEYVDLNITRKQTNEMKQLLKQLSQLSLMMFTGSITICNARKGSIWQIIKDKLFRYIQLKLIITAKTSKMFMQPCSFSGKVLSAGIFTPPSKAVLWKVFSMAYLRLDRLLSNICNTTRSDITRAIKRGRVTVNGEIVKKPDFKADTQTDTITLDGNELNIAEFVYIMACWVRPSGVSYQVEIRS